jgi:hypothetical protein
MDNAVFSYTAGLFKPSGSCVWDLGSLMTYVANARSYQNTFKRRVDACQHSVCMYLLQFPGCSLASFRQQHSRRSAPGVRCLTAL